MLNSKAQRKYTKTTAKQLERRLHALQEIAVELMAQKDPHALLNILVEKAMNLLYCDACSLYLRYDESSLIFQVARNQSISIPFQERLIPLTSQTLATHCFNKLDSIILDDVYNIPNTTPYTFDKSYDKFTNYRTKSMLVYPLVSSRGEGLGVLQLINRKNNPRELWPSDNEEEIAKMPTFSTADAKLIESFAAVASASLENAKLHKSIKDLFEGFVKASVHAIEARDDATRGHSERVAYLTVSIAQKASQSSDPELKDVKFTSDQLAELRYASLLHDFGKIGVREAVLQKEEKLDPFQKIRIESRFKEFRAATEIKVFKDYLTQLMTEKRPPSEFEMAALEKRIKEFGMKIEDYWNVVLELNTPSILDENRANKLAILKTAQCHNLDGQCCPLLEPDEAFNLQILRGTLSDEERLEIESHVVHTFEFLKQIPWTKELAMIPEIAAYHHEKLDGTGYPSKTRADRIPVQSRIMAVADIFDALAANDRPYKPAVPITRTFDILHSEVKNGKIDGRFLKILMESKIYEATDFVKLKGAPKKRAA